MKNLIVIADWVKDDLYKSEFLTALSGHIPSNSGLNISFVSSSKSDIHHAFLLHQIAYTTDRLGAAHETVILMGSDLRSSFANSPSPFVVLKLQSGIFVLGQNTGKVFSMIRDELEEAFVYSPIDLDKSYIARDVFPRICSVFMDARQQELDLDELHMNQIPPMFDKYIGHITNDALFLTTLTHQDLKGKYSFGDKIHLIIGSENILVKYVENIENEDLSTSLVYSGSSGDINDPYLELKLIDQSSHKINPGDKVTLAI